MFVDHRLGGGGENVEGLISYSVSQWEGGEGTQFLWRIQLALTQFFFCLLHLCAKDVFAGVSYGVTSREKKLCFRTGFGQIS